MTLAALLSTCLLLLMSTAAAMRADVLSHLRQETVDMFYHGYSNYMQHAFPEDELRPLTCGPLTRDRDDPGRIGLNDALGNYSLTLIDSLSTLAILAGGPQEGSYTGPQALSDFQEGIAQFVRHYGDGRHGPSGTGTRATGFDLDSKVQVFETVIRGVGGLLSAHLFAIGELPMPGYQAASVPGFASRDPLEPVSIPWPNGFTYDGQLLRLALDLAQRLLPAFYTKTGIPYPRVNLRTGIPFYVNSPLHQDSGKSSGPEKGREITETCSAGAGSLTLEFSVLSRLTGDTRFEQAAKRSFWEVWRRRSDIGLIGNGIDAEKGLWIGPHAGIGAGMDSFFEYALKSHILLSGHEMPNVSASPRQTSATWLDPASLHGPLPREMHSSEAFLEAWHQAHASVKRHLYTDRSHYPYYSNSHRATGQPYTMWIDSLGAFYPGLLALAGEVDEAIEANLVYTALWTRYAALPERWSIRDRNIEAGIGWWPGRPEFIESTYHIYRATRDPWYLHVGEMVLKDIKRRCHAPCGWAGLQDVRTGEKQDRMESFFLGETTKYMYLLFDVDHPLNKLDAAYVFTTEGHPLLLPRQKWSRQQQSKQHPHTPSHFTNTCPMAPPPENPLTGSATAARPQLFEASLLTGLHHAPNIHGPMDVLQVEDNAKGRVTMHRAASNHSLFPWTLPPSMLPPNGTCVASSPRVMTVIEFPARDAATDLVSKLGASVAWFSYAGPTVRVLEGLKLQLLKEYSDELEQDVWRITHVGNTELGRHETVFFYAEHVRHHKDEAFTCKRRLDAVEIELLLHVDNDAGAAKANASRPLPTKNGSSAAYSLMFDHAAPPHDSPSPDAASMASESLFRHLLRAVSSVFDPAHTHTPSPAEPEPSASIAVFYAHTATGPGAVPLPSTPDTPVPGSPLWHAARPAANFPWSSVFLAGYACHDAPLPAAASRAHHVIVMRRGRCSFARKLRAIPSFVPGPTALQLVIVVDEDAPDAAAAATAADTRLDDRLDRPLLTHEQLTPRGSPRLHGVPMVLVRGAPGDYLRFGSGLAAGMRRKYILESQELVIANALVM